jgi:cytochrome P450
VVVWYSSANRDESAFRNAAHFDVGRWPNEHLSFGFGRHFCLGASLARLEIETLLQGLIERDVGLECTGQVDWMLSNFAQSPKRMPVRLSRGRH